jgi:hypothetical protein
LLADGVASDAVLMDEESRIHYIELPACALSSYWNIEMRFMFALGHDRNDPQVWLSELLMAAELAGGIPLLSHFGVSPNHSAK